ncbi:MAG: hypothetical protein IT373_17165 [Polyangiaceae bacterium]|nr:hypothetical protein [Polyangiaceae bacterium]
MKASHSISKMAALRAVLRRRLPVGLAAFALAACAVLGLVVAVPPLYRAKAVLVIDPPLVPGTGRAELEAQVQALTLENLSRPRLQALAADLGMTRAGVTPALAADALLRDIDIVNASADLGGAKTSISITVNLRGSQPELVADAANALVAFYVDAERERMLRRTSALAEQLEALGSRLDAEDERMAALRRDQVGELPPEVAARIASLERLNAELARLRARGQDLERRRVVVAPLPPGAAAEAPPSPPPAPTAPAVSPPTPPPSLPEAEAELTRLQAELRDLRSRFTDEHPAVVQVKRQLEVVKGHLATLRVPRYVPRVADVSPVPSTTKGAPDVRPRPRVRAIVLPEVEGELQSLLDEERMVEQRIAFIEKMGLAAPGGLDAFSALLPRYDGLRTAYLALLQRYEESRASLGADGQFTPFRVVEEAVPPASPAGPDRFRLLAVGLVLALFGAGLAVLTAEHLDGSFHSAGDLRKFTRVPVLATIPRIATAGDARHKLLVRGLYVAAIVAASAAAFGAAYNVTNDNQSIARMLVK